MFIYLWLCSLFLQNARAEEMRLAVLEFQSVGINNPELSMQLSDEMRGAGLEVFPPETSFVSILTRENLMDTLQKEGRDVSCLAESCALKVGRNVGARFVITGQLAQVEGMNRLTFSIYDTQNNQMLGQKSIQSTDIRELLIQTHTVGATFIESTLGGFDAGRTGRRRIDPKEDSWSVPPSDLGVLSLSLDAEIDRLGGSVQVDGKSICTQLPCSRHIKTGSHTVSVNVPDCDPWQKKVNTESLTNLKVQLSCRFGFVSLTAPDGAKVSFQKKAYEKQANGLYRLPTGSGTLKVFDDCHNGESKTTTLTSLSINKLTMGLGPKTTKSVTINVRDDAGKALSGRVFADNSALGSTPSVSVPICAQNVRVEIPARKRSKKVAFSTAKSTYELSLNNAVKGYKPILVRKGKFTMGDTWEDYWFRLPPRRVQITYDFYIMQSEVTQDLVTKVLNPGYQGWYVPNMPEKMDWVDAAHFANELSKREGLEPCYSITPNTEKPKKKLSSYQYPPNRKVVWKDKACTGWRLPTEAEWEYAAKGGSRNEKYKYAGSNNCSSVGWFAEELDDYEGPHTVCAKKKNSLGLCDMSGNFAEWIWGTQKKLVTQMTEEDKKEDNPIKRPILVDPIGWDPDEIYQEGDDPLVRGADLSKRCKEDIPYITSYRFSSQTGFRLVRRK